MGYQEYHIKKNARRRTDAIIKKEYKAKSTKIPEEVIKFHKIRSLLISERRSPEVRKKISMPRAKSKSNKKVALEHIVWFISVIERPSNLKNKKLKREVLNNRSKLKQLVKESKEFIEFLKKS